MCGRQVYRLRAREDGLARPVLEASVAVARERKEDAPGERTKGRRSEEFLGIYEKWMTDWTLRAPRTEAAVYRAKSAMSVRTYRCCPLLPQ